MSLNILEIGMFLIMIKTNKMDMQQSEETLKKATKNEEKLIGHHWLPSGWGAIFSDQI